MDNQKTFKDKKELKKFHFDNAYFENPVAYDDIILYQIGDLSCEGGYVVGEHIQICYEISYIVSGKGMFGINDKNYNVKKGDVFLSLPNEVHKGKADTIDPFRFFYIGIDFKKTENNEKHFDHIKKMLDNVKNPILSDRRNIQVPFINMFNEIINAKSYGGLMMKTYLYQIVVLSYRDFFDAWEKEYLPREHANESKKIVYNIINYIDTNLCNISELSEIATRLGYNYSYISRVFSHEMNLNIQDYYNRKRFERAAQLLKKTSLSITQISEELHYISIHSFSRAFHNYFGISPTRYQSISRKKIEQ